MTEPEYAPLPDGGRLAYTVNGAGPALLLLRPVGGSILSWGQFAAELSRHARVIAFDPRGTGASSQARLTTSTRLMARDAVALLDHLGLPRVCVFGLSLGGMVATWLAVDAPSRVEKLMLASTMAQGLELRPLAALRGFSMIRALARSTAEAESSLVTRILSRQFRKAHPAKVREAQDHARERPASHLGLLTMLAAAARHDARAHLGQIAAPTRVFAGGRDTLITRASQQELVEGIPGASLEVFADAGHDLSIEVPERCADEVRLFMASAPA